MTDLGESKAVPERYSLDHRTLSEPPIPSDTWDWDKKRHIAMGQFAKKLIEELGIQEGVTRMAVGCQERAVANVRELEEQLAVAIAEKDELRKDRSALNSYAQQLEAKRCE